MVIWNLKLSRSLLLKTMTKGFNVKKEDQFKILELSTSGWFLVEDIAQNLTKERCDAMIKEYLRQGVAPERLMAVSQDDPRYPTDEKREGYVPVDM